MSSDAMHTLRLARDFLIGLALFLLICSITLAGEGHSGLLLVASAVRTSVLATVSGFCLGWPAIEGDAHLLPAALVVHDRAVVILALVFSGMVAVNLWFARVIRCVYTAPHQGEGSDR
ncbi:MAG TPA: hypothetical protein VNK52_10960 [Hyphomicrobiaceae bacterium]|nr:hypothetical protein [Hyphomicrobiaceae bacterium]